MFSDICWTVKEINLFHPLPDGRKKFPINHGSTSADTLLKVCGAMNSL